MFTKSIKIEVGTEELFTPEKMLLLAVLGRAFWDLDYIQNTSLMYLRSSVYWFRGSLAKTPGPVISFDDAKEHLNLTADILKTIDISVAETTQYLEAVVAGSVNHYSIQCRYNFAFMNKHLIACKRRNNTRFFA